MNNVIDWVRIDLDSYQNIPDILLITMSNTWINIYKVLYINVIFIHTVNSLKFDYIDTEIVC